MSYLICENILSFLFSSTSHALHHSILKYLQSTYFLLFYTYFIYSWWSCSLNVHLLQWILPPTLKLCNDDQLFCSICLTCCIFSYCSWLIMKMFLIFYVTRQIFNQVNPSVYAENILNLLRKKILSLICTFFSLMTKFMN